MPHLHLPHTLQAASVRDRRERAPGDLLEVWAERLVAQVGGRGGRCEQMSRG